MEFILGSNYWASNAGIEMWQKYDVDTINKDLKILSQHGVKYLRVFPLWRDFQPVKSNYGGRGRILENVMEDGTRPSNEYYLDEVMMTRFAEFLDICDSYGMKVIVGLITGWMSGGLFVPTAFYGKNVLTDPMALYYEQLFIKGFVKRFKNRQTVYAWDLGNECNVMGLAENQYIASAWSGTIANAIRAADPSRQVVSGMHNLCLDGVWRIQDQAMFTDVLTTHPYPMWCRHTTIDALLSFRTTMHATTQAKWYADMSGKPCLTEEIGTMGPMICSDEKAADFLRLNLYSLWANGSTGVLWWCNHDLDKIDDYPYSIQMIERELGLLTSENTPKPALLEMKKFSDFLAESKIDLPKAEEHGVCILTKGQDHWGVAYMTYVLAKSLGLNLKFTYGHEQELPDSRLYVMPSVSGMIVLPKTVVENLLKKVKNGADLYISADNAALQGFEAFAGLKVIDSYTHAESNTVSLNGKEIHVKRTAVKRYVPTTANVLAADDSGNPFLTVNAYGKGRVFFVAAPIESNLIESHNAFDTNVGEIYRTALKDHIDALRLSTDAKDVVFTLHNHDGGAYFIAINHSASEKALNLDLKDNFTIEQVIYGDSKTIKPYDACILKLKSK